MRTSLGIPSLAALPLAALLLVAPAAAAPDDPGAIRPGALHRGADVRVPHVVGTTLVDGDTRMRIDGDYALLLGWSGDSYVVESDNRILRVQPAEQRVVKRIRDGSQALLSSDGARLVVTRIGPREKTTVRVLSARTGREQASGRFAGYVTALAADRSRVVLSASAPARTFWWDPATDRRQRIVARSGSYADVGANRLSTLTGDPYRGGCAVVTTLRRPVRQLWRSCDEMAFEFSPNGSRMATAPIYADGLGPGTLWLRKSDGGRKLATYRASWFSDVQWESNRALLLGVHTRRNWAEVRCVRADCERASKLRKNDV